MQRPWESAVPGPQGPPSAWSLLPDELEALGCPGHPPSLFGALQRPWTWQGGAPRLGRASRAWLEGACDLHLPRIADRAESGDGTVKLALELADGLRVETVHMPRDLNHPRVTLCLSSQVGCALGCAFCATGAMGIQRNLGAGEIVAQVLLAMTALGPSNPSQLTLVFMGMGEPLHNLEAVHRAIRLLAHPAGLGLPMRRITVSTAGLVAGIDRLAGLHPRPWLAVSLNAGTDGLRDQLMPVNRAHPLADLMAAVRRWKLKPREKLTFEYVLLGGVNDRPADAEALVQALGEFRHRHNLNLIPMNAHPGSPFGAPEGDRVEGFAAILKAQGCFVTLRKSRGRDVGAACGQLVGKAGRDG
ncbi:MAG: 23S rRNA (adenine(2503)-C(2))-methyltransferase RlmN [Acidobacteria bacterium]|nr:23S rRNA (adenine(2503)-C(2))-methyltransferase RlmN [Acidobacteriota bacterium]